ncbi:GTPase, IMAP family member 5, partial [Chelydra serpentina]
FCERQAVFIDGRKITVVDTPGLFDTNARNKETSKEIGESVKHLSPGIHAIIHIMQLGHFTREEKEVAKEIEKIFRFEAKKYMIFLFTRKEDLEEKTLEEFLSNGDKDLWSLIQTCGDQRLAFNNKAEGNEHLLRCLSCLK